MLIKKPIALLVNEFMPKDSKNLIKRQKEDQSFIKNYENWEPNPKKHERFRGNQIFFIGLNFVVNKVGH